MRCSLLIFGFLFLVGIVCAQNRTQESSTTTTRSPTTKTSRRTTARPVGRVKPCIKHPSNFQQLSKPCGGFQKPECLAECQGLGHTRAYCTQREHFCLCHSGDLYSC